MSNPEKANEGVAELSGNTYYPPPPPNPPPAQQTQQQHDADYQQQQHLPQQQQQQHLPQQEFHHEQQQQQQQQFPPPPAQQPPPQQQQQPYFPPPPTQTDEKQSHQQQQSTYTIPAYNPANPVFAPPPSGSDTTAQGQTGQVPGESYNQQPQQSQQQHQQFQQSQQQHQQQPPQTEQHGQKKGGWGDRFKQFVSAGAAAPINSLAHKLGSQSFLPETLDKECDKAAAILKSFCTKGVYADPGAGQPPTSTDPKAKESTGGLIDPTKEKPKNRVIVTIPPKVISKAVGLAIFTTLRAGFQVSGATGSGILIARLPDGSWSPPSGINVHSLGGGFQIGLDIYDCVCVINSKEALAAFMNTRVSLGSDLTVVAGPYGAGGAVDFGTAVQRGRDETDKTATGSSNVPGDAQPPTAAPQQGQPSNTLKPEGGDPKRRSLSASTFKPVFSYVKSRGFYAGVQVDGTVVMERKDANAAFYGTSVAVQQILQGHVPHQGPQNMWPVGARGLLETLKGAEAGALGDRPTASGAGVQASGNIPPTNAPPMNAPPTNAPPMNAPPMSTAPAQTSSGAPPAYVDDGSHANVGDVKYA